VSTPTEVIVTIYISMSWGIRLGEPRVEVVAVFSPLVEGSDVFRFSPTFSATVVFCVALVTDSSGTACANSSKPEATAVVPVRLFLVGVLILSDGHHLTIKCSTSSGVDEKLTVSIVLGTEEQWK
jgi:hypothetical protein